MIGVLLAALMVAVSVGSATATGQDIGFLAVVTVIFLGVGGLLLYSRLRKLKSALVYRIYEAGIVRETKSGRQELLFTDLAGLGVRRLQINGGHPFLTIVLVSSSGAEIRIQESSIDNVDDSLVRLLEQRSGRRAEAFGGQRS
ncbi:MAG: hypothetical protein JOZ47_10250 [Kutzneria sp.]|nr:hypothetical protein [Kutzneria sp.]